MIELGRRDIMIKVLLTSHRALPIERHIDAVHVMANVGQRHNFRLVYDPSHPEIDHNL